MVETAVST